MKTKIQILMILAVLFSSCTVSHLVTDDNRQQYTPTNFETIEVYSTADAGKPYAVIGQVIASTETLSDNAEVSVKQLKKEAAKLGADGIINLRLEIGNGVLSNAITSSGTAVKFTN